MRWRVGIVAFVVLFVVGGLLLFLLEAWLLPNAADSAEAQQLAGLSTSGIFGSGISLGGASLVVLLIAGSAIGAAAIARILDTQMMRVAERVVRIVTIATLDVGTLLLGAEVWLRAQAVDASNRIAVARVTRCCPGCS